MNKFSVLISVISLFLLVFVTFSYPNIDNFNIEPLYIENGEPFRYPIWAIDQDSRGFMWFGTMNGAARYNGYEIKMFSYDPNDSNSISGNIVYAIEEDQCGHIWIGTNNGLNEFIPETEKFIHYKHDLKDSLSLGGNIIKSIRIDSRQILWIGTEGGGLNRFIRDTGTFKRYQFDENQPTGLSNSAVTAIYEDQSHNLWIGTQNGLNLWRWEDIEKQQPLFRYFTHDPNQSNTLSGNHITSIYEDEKGTFWIGTYYTGFNKLTFPLNGDFRKHHIKRYLHDPDYPVGLGHNHAWAGVVEFNNYIWIGTIDGGLNCFDPETETFIQIRPDNYLHNTTFENSITSLYKDSCGILWIGTANNGVLLLLGKSKGFRNHLIQTNIVGQTKDVSIHKILHDKAGNYWLGSRYCGLYKYECVNNSLIRYLNPNVHDDENTVFDILDYNDKQLLCGTFGEGVWIFDKKDKRFYPHPINRTANGKYSKECIVNFHLDRLGYFWLKTWGNGLLQFNQNWECAAHYTSDTSDSTSINCNIVVGSYEDSSDNLWISTFGGGLYKANATQRKNQGMFSKLAFKRYQVDTEDSSSLSSNVVMVTYEDSKGFLWVLTEGGGINRYDYQTDSFKRYTTELGLADNRACAIAEDKHGNFWISTLNGLSHFNPQTEIFTNYTTYDGLLSNVFNRGTVYQSENGEIFFGCLNGFISFYPDEIKCHEIHPPIVLTGFNLFGAPAKLDTTITTKKIILLDYTQKIFSFEFAALNYINPKKNRYAYKLEGFHDDWIYIGNYRHAHFTNLSYGEYNFRVKAANHNGIWDEKGISVRLIILPPWWRTRWAYTCYTFIGLGLLLIIWQIQIRRMMIKNELNMQRIEANKLQEIDRIKSRFFANISHEFRTPLTLILGPLEQMLEDKFKGDPKDQYRMMIRHGQHLLRLINQLLDVAKLEAGRMSLQINEDNMLRLIKGIVLSFSSLAQRKGVELKFKAHEETIIAYLDREKLEKIITNLLSNAFKFTPKGGNVSVAVSVIQGNIHLNRPSKGVIKKSTLEPDIKKSSLERGQRGAFPSTRYIQITVRDTGIGIAADRLEKIFDRFYQIDDSVKREQEGAGIGLSLTKELVELHHGEISVESEPGQGTSFTVLLPLGKAHLKESEIIEANEDFSALPQSTSLKQIDTTVETYRSVVSDASTHEETAVADQQTLPIILIVEDNQDVINYIRDYLKPRYRIIEAFDGEDGLVKAIESLPDLIISDVMMPNMDGFEFCKKIKTDERTSYIPVILLTARAGEESKIAGLETGADDYITKPFKVRELQVRVKNLIRQRQKLRERFSRDITLHPQDIAVTSADERFLKRVMAVVEQHIADSGFDIQTMAREVGLSRMQLHRKLCALTDQSPSEFIRVMRLKRAAQLLEQKAGNVTEIAYEVGFNNIAYFAKRFRELYGLSPSEYTH